MSFRRTRTIVSDSNFQDETKEIEREADIIITAAIVGLAVVNLTNPKSGGGGVQFDMDPRDKEKTAQGKDKEGVTEWQDFTRIIGKIDKTTADYLKKINKEPSGKVHAGLAEDHAKGAVIMGVYTLAGQTAPTSVKDPAISKKGRALYEAICAEFQDVIEGVPTKTDAPDICQYTGRGAYTGFVDNPDGTPVGPRSTIRSLVPDPDSVLGTNLPDDPILGDLYARWLPPQDSAVWNSRKRAYGNSKGTIVPWGIIGGDKANEKAKKKVNDSWVDVTPETNTADYLTSQMKEKRMAFFGDPGVGEIVGYTHGMIQAIYKAYTLGPRCTPYEIAVGPETTKLSSCFACATFMSANGYPPTSMHLGRGESWIPLYYPDQGGRAEPYEMQVIRDLNNAWYQKCEEYVENGLLALDDTHIRDDHRSSRDRVKDYLGGNRKKGRNLAATLILDAITYHKSDAMRVDDTLK